MGQNDVTCLAIESVDEPFGNIFVRQMSQARKNALLQFPGIMLDGLEHVAAVIGFNDDRRTAPQSLRYQSGNVPEIHQGCDPGARVGSSEAKVIDCIVWHRKWMK